MRRGIAAVLFFLGPALDAVAGTRTRIAEVELVGPLERVEIALAPDARARIEGALGRGETRRLDVPMSSRGGFEKAPEIVFAPPLDPTAPPGRARFVAWRDADLDQPILSPALRARARPAVRAGLPTVSPAVPFVLLATAIGVVFLRRRPVLALATSVGAAALLWFQVRPPREEGAARVTVWDAVALDATWRRMDAAADEIEVGPGPFQLAVEPEDVPVEWRVPLDPARPPRARAGGARLFVTRAIERPEGVLTRETNLLADLDGVWLREEGEWRALGPWRLGERLPTGGAAGAPPGWLASALPQGVSVLVARSAAPGSGPLEWLRIAGF